MQPSTFEEKLRQAKAMKFSMPSEVSYEKVFLPDGLWAYAFRHTKLGELGRLLIIPYTDSQIQFSVEVAGEPQDPITLKRREILEPITKKLVAQMEVTCGSDTDVAPLSYSIEQQHPLLKSQMMPCVRCCVPTAMLIIAAGAFTAAHLEDYARLMYENIMALNVPTWIVSAEREVVINGDRAGESLVLKVWPLREAARFILSTELNPQLDILMQSHCQ